MGLESRSYSETNSASGRRSRGTVSVELPCACFVIDDEPGVCHFLSMVLREFGIEVSVFADAGSALDQVSDKNPCLIFLDVSLEGSDAVDAIRGLAAQGFSGAVQLISGRYQAILDKIVQVGERHALRMLPALCKPFDAAAVRAIVGKFLTDDMRTHRGPVTSPHPKAFPEPIGLDEALRKGWIEFWYQPKVDLKSRGVFGVEALARLRHPTFGVLTPSRFIPGADEQALQDLAILALHTALRDGIDLAAAGYDLQFAANVTMATLSSTSLPSILRHYHKDTHSWPGLVLEVAEDQVVAEMEAALETALQLKVCGVKLSIDDFGRAYSSLDRLKILPFAELKIDRTFVKDCATDATNTLLCRSVVDIAHRFGCRACAEGIEKSSDLAALVAMGCDHGQGYYFAPPMPKDQLLASLRGGLRPPPAAQASGVSDDGRRLIATI